MEAGVGGQRRARGGGRQAREREREKGECGERENGECDSGGEEELGLVC